MRILAAGSLRVVWPQLMAAFQADAVCDFGPAGLLRERIEAGEACDFFASANLAHPQALLESGRALRVAPFTTNRLCLSVRAQAMREGEDWLSLLTRGICGSAPQQQVAILPAIIRSSFFRGWATRAKRSENAR